jgi:hypothetical protein
LLSYSVLDYIAEYLGYKPPKRPAISPTPYIRSTATSCDDTKCNGLSQDAEAVRQPIIFGRVAPYALSRAKEGYWNEEEGQKECVAKTIA